MDLATYPVRRIVLLIILGAITLCHGWQHQTPLSNQRTSRYHTSSIGIRMGHFQQRRTTSTSALLMEIDDGDDGGDDDMELCSSSRRKYLQSAATHFSMVLPAILVASLEEAGARNLPVSNGASTSRAGTADALKPIVLLRLSLSDLKLQMRNKQTLDLEGMPTTEEDFKRIFDAYSDPVSYKQKFLDQNAFLVYYTKGFDGPGRPNIEADNENEKQTLQFGARNEAWINWENFLVELKFVGEDDDDQENLALKYLDSTLRCVDNYIKLAPPEQVKEAQRAVDRYW